MKASEKNPNKWRYHQVNMSNNDLHIIMHWYHILQTVVRGKILSYTYIYYKLKSIFILKPKNALKIYCCLSIPMVEDGMVNKYIGNMLNLYSK